MSDPPLLAVSDLQVEFHTKRGVVRAVDGVSLDVQAGRTLGVVGESGCGKSVTALSIMRLIQSPPGRITGGQIRYRGDDLRELSEARMRSIRGNHISMVFQEPMTSLNPVYPVGEQVAEAVRLHQRKGRAEAMAAAVDMLALVGIPSPAERARDYPHQLSGGMRQRVVIAMALACRPELLIADEPTTALDVTIQAQILALLGGLQAELGMGILLITHDLGVVAETADDVLVMYAGRVVERAPTEMLFRGPRHHYTAGLLRSVPGYLAPTTDSAAPDSAAPDDTATGDRSRRPRLQEIPGMVPSPFALPTGCKFQDRCPAVQDLCRTDEPPLTTLAPGHQVRCHAPVEVAA